MATQLPAVGFFDIPANIHDLTCEFAAEAHGMVMETVRSLPGGHTDIPLVSVDGSSHIGVDDYAAFRVDTFGGGAASNVTHILTTTLHKGSVLILYGENSARAVTLKHNQAGDNNILISDGEDYSLVNGPIILQYWGTYWREVARSRGEAITALQEEVDTLAWFVRAIIGGADGVMAYSPQGTNSFAVTAQTIPGMTVQALAGAGFIGGAPVRVAAAQNSANLNAPTINPRIDTVELSAAGAIKVLTGAEGASPVAPSIETGYMKLAEIYHRVGETSIKNTDDSTNGYITDSRTFINA